MTGYAFMFIDFIKKEHGYITYEDNNQSKILGKGIMEKDLHDNHRWCSISKRS